MDQLSHATLRWEVRQHIEALFMVLDDLGRSVEGLSQMVHTHLQDAIADVQARLQAFDELVESALVEAEVDVESQDALARLIEQLRARQQDVEDQLHCLNDTSAENWEARAVWLEAAWSQLDKTMRVAMQELASPPRSDEGN